jgi:hypothetical protein
VGVDVSHAEVENVERDEIDILLLRVAVDV